MISIDLVRSSRDVRDVVLKMSLVVGIGSAIGLSHITFLFMSSIQAKLKQLIKNVKSVHVRIVNG
jgi:hypothetical protein